ncbi:NAD(P)/FAD-dependent oxidoreductase [Xenorhabdus nematophila]|uniref:flavin-containing monooxygenase n=2 Tax=Xenorhabdus nematophila TaxID=628 RepID=UPI000543D5CF|nr:NAD(P)/FAD-dependent oxidoreductase [Xenorhabdus nematophila]CEF33597.1 putative monooxygenase, flavin-binding family [Xenorhabdus nematophila str. Websteri]AYA41667.1 NAD(P)/FAD-dependent oxidoreductase [Xenorhabdus nematophila]MBA0020404.1 NAD(P)/FAD-dependent oxidoreductase [Xenorhabdus nematophila]MCB4424599.1 NAD(P)-binding domain-containing protein [Xenorhabdus nematophila]QNJ36050.1 NAD(P)/FAD-dependent oxidoreductase [Xenorhabdus nematophila]
MSHHCDILIMGAGVAGIGMACHLKRECPDKQMIILERRQAIGGTWDLFRYPGIRSDSDMMTFGYKFRPWSETSVFADGPSIKNYVNETAKEYGIDKKIQFGLKITHTDWSNITNQWTITAVEEASGEVRTFTCNYLVAATGYYNYDKAYMPEYPGVEDFKGPVIHPQHWPEKLDYKGKRVIVIGSGATAATLVPTMANDTKHITMLQRSPSYYLSPPANDHIAAFLNKFLPKRWVYTFSRNRNLFIHRLLYKSSRHVPTLLKSFLLSSARRRVGDKFNMNHLMPKYMPWDERLCVIPNGNLLRALKEGKASVVTDQIERFTENGILLQSGQELPADIIVSSTGLNLLPLGGIEISIDEKKLQGNERMLYKGTLIQDIPNFAYLFGYINSSWTLKIDLSADYICRLLKEMDRRGAKSVTPYAQPDEMLKHENIFGELQAGYVKRGDGGLPRQGRSPNWHVSHDYKKDKEVLGQPVDDTALRWK